MIEVKAEFDKGEKKWHINEVIFPYKKNSAKLKEAPADDGHGHSHWFTWIIKSYEIDLSIPIIHSSVLRGLNFLKNQALNLRSFTRCHVTQTADLEWFYLLILLISVNLLIDHTAFPFQVA